MIATCYEVVIRIVPAGLSRSSPSEVSSASMLASVGRNIPKSRSPAAVGATLRVVRVSSRTPSLVSRRRIVWLSDDWEVPSFAAARVKLPASATL